MISMEITKATFNSDATHKSRSLEEVLEEIQRYCRRKNIELLHTAIQIPGLIPIRLVFWNRGNSLRLDYDWGTSHPGTLSGLLDAVGDFIRIRCESSPDAIDVYQKLLGL